MKGKDPLKQDEDVSLSALLWRNQTYRDVSERLFIKHALGMTKRGSVAESTNTGRAEWLAIPRGRVRWWPSGRHGDGATGVLLRLPRETRHQGKVSF